MVIHAQQQEVHVSIFQDREAAFEAKFAHDEEQAFLVRAARDRRFGLWVAERLGLSGETRQAYARATVRLALSGGDGETIISRAERDLRSRGISIRRMELRQVLLQAEMQAHTHVVGTPEMAAAIPSDRCPGGRSAA